MEELPNRNPRGKKDAKTKCAHLLAFSVSLI